MKKGSLTHKFLSVFLAITLVLGLNPGLAYADAEPGGGDTEDIALITDEGSNEGNTEDDTTVDDVAESQGVVEESPVPSIDNTDQNATHVVVIGEEGYDSLTEAITAANGMTGDITVEINGKVEYTDSTPDLTGAYGSISFVGKTADAEISITRDGSKGYISGSNQGNDCDVNFSNLILSKPTGAYASDAGFMNVYFTVYRVGDVSYTNCTFPDGACSQGTKTTYTNCTFANETFGEYSLWVYASTDVTVDGGSFTGVRGVKMYGEGAAKTGKLTLFDVTFTESVAQKPAIVLTYGESVTLKGNTYSSTGVFELDKDGAPNGTTVTSTDAITCVNDDGACGVLVDGKIYTTVADAAAVAVAGSEVTLLHESTETVEFAEGVVLDKGDYTAADVTVKLPSVAKVGNNEYTSIDEAIANWSNGTTLTLLSDVTLSDVITLKSTEYHTLDLGTYTMTAASGKDAIQIENCGRSSASYALDIKADAANPGGITATGKAIVRTAGKSNVKDRPIIRFYNGIFNGSYIVYHSGSNGTNCPQFQFHGGVFNGTIYTNRALNQFYGGTFNRSLMMSVDSSAYTLIAGGTFKQLSNLYMSALNSGKFTIGSAKGVYDKEVYIDDNGYYVVAAAEPAEGIEADVANTPGTNDYLAYSKVATEGQLGYTDVYTALKNNKTATVTVYVDELDMTGSTFTGTIVVPAESTLTITNAPEGLVVTNAAGEALTANANGTYTTVPPKGSTVAYLGANGVWGENWTNASVSQVYELYEGETKIATSSLNNVDGIIDGDVYVTWSIPFAGSTDEYWTVEWAEGYPKYDMNMTEVALVVDGTEVCRTPVQFNGPDNLDKIVALAEGYTGGVVAYTSLTDAMGKFNGRKVNVLCDVTEDISGFYGATLTTNVEGGVTITTTNTDWVGFDDVTVKSGVTVNILNVFSSDSENVIEGTLNVGETYYHGYDAKTTIQNGGKVTVGGSTILRYNENADSGIYIYGDDDDSTVEFDCDYYIGAYSGTFYAENANIETGYFLLKNSYDNSDYADIDMTLDDSSLTVVGTGDGQDSFIIDDQASLTLVNGASIKDVRDFNILAGANLTLVVDETSSISATYVNIAEDVPFKYEKNEDGTVTIAPKTFERDETNKVATVYNAEGLRAFAEAVNNGNNFKGWTVKLAADIDLAAGATTFSTESSSWTPIGTSENPFKGTFDGQSHTISNLVITGNNSNVGLFGFTTNGEIKNLTIENANVSGRLNVGVVAGTPYTSKYTNIKVTGHVEVNGMAYVGGVGGKNAYADWTDITVDVDSSSYVNANSVENGTAYRTYVGGVVGFNGEGSHTFKSISSNIKVIGSTCDIGGLFGIAHYGNNFENVTFTGSVVAPEGAYQVGGIAGVWHNKVGYTVTFTNVTSTGSVTVGDETTTGSIVGGAYATSTDTPATSGTLIVEGAKVWPIVAKVGDVEYASLKTAVEAAKNGGTVTLVCDVPEVVNVPEGANITLDLSGYTLTGSIQAPNADLTVKNGSIYNIDSLVSALEINAGELTLADVNIKSTRHAVRVDGAVNVTIDGGTYQTMGASGLTTHAVNVSGEAIVVIKNGTFVGPAGTTADSGAAVNVQADSTVTIEGGSFSGGKLNTLASGGELDVYGGIFNQSVPGVYCADGYVPAEFAEGVYGVKYQYEAKVGRKNYETLAEALAAVEDGGTVVMVADITAANLTIDKNVEIKSADGYSLNVLGAIHISGSNALTLTDVKTNASVYADSNAAGATVNGQEVNGTEAYKSTVVSDGTTVTVTNPEWAAQVLDRDDDYYYMTLAEAIADVQTGENTIKVLKDCGEDLTIVQAPGVKVTIDGNDKTFSGTITVDGQSKAYDTAALTIKDVNFDTANITKDASINLGGSDATRYTNHVSVINCNFTGTGYEKVGIKSYTGGCKNLTVDGCAATGMHSLMQLYGTTGLVVSDCEVADSKNGISVRSSTGTISNCKVDVTGYGLRADGDAAATLTISNNEIEAEKPVVVRKATNDGYTLVVGEGNTLTSTTEGAYQIIVTNGSDDEDVVNPTGNFTIEGDISELKVYPNSEYVATVDGKGYMSLTEALKAATSGCTIEILKDVTVSDTWDCRSNGAKFSVPVTINGNDHTLKLTGAVDDKNWNTVFRFEADATVKNLTIDVSEAASVQRGISSKLDVTVDNCTFIGNGATSKYAVIFGEGAGTAIGDVVANVTNSSFTNWSYGVSDNQNGQDAKSVNVSGSTFTNAGVLLSASESVTFTGNTVTAGSEVNITSYAAPGSVEVTATGNTLADGGEYEITVNPENITADEAFKTPVATTNGKYYVTLEKAAAVEGATEITLLVDITVDELVATDKTIITNGKTLTGTLKTSGALTVTYAENTEPAWTVVSAEDGEVVTYTESIAEGVVTRTYKSFVAVAKIGEAPYESLAAAVEAANDGETITLVWAEGDDPIAMNGAVYGKSVTITGTALVDWSKDWLFVGRGGEGDGKLIFSDAHLTAKANAGRDIGIHVSGATDDTAKNDGELVITGGSDIELDWLVNRNKVTVEGDSALTVVAGLGIHGRNAEEAESGVAQTAALTVEAGSTLTMKNYTINVGNESYGVLNIKGTVDTPNMNVKAGLGTVNVNGGNVKVANTLTNNGVICISGASAIAATVTGDGWVYMNGVTLDADTKLLGAKVRFASGTNDIDGSVIDDGFFQVGIGAYNGVDASVDTTNGVVVNAKNAKIGSSGSTYAGWVGTGFYDTDAEKAAAMTDAKYVLNIENSIAEFGYLHVSNDGELNVKGNATDKVWYNNSDYSFYAGDFIINGTATFDATDVLALYTTVSCDNGTDKPGTLNVNAGTEYEAERHNGAIAGTNFTLYKTGVVNVAEDAKLHIGEYTSIAADAAMNIGGAVTALGTVTNNGTINLTAVDATLTTPEAPTVKSTLEDYKVAYADGAYKLIAKDYVAQVGEKKYESLAEAFAAAKSGEEVKILKAGTYALSTSGEDITITGAVDGVVFEGMGAKNMGGASVTFNNVTFNWTNANYTGLQHCGDMVYNNCIINGQPFLYGTSEAFNNCTFNQNSADAYNVWTYGAEEVAFNECTFNSAGKSVLIYSEDKNLFNDVVVTDCDFIASAPVEGKAAIEMDSSLTAGIKLTIDGETTATGFAAGNVSGNSLWNNKKGNATEANNDITVVVDNKTVLAPLALVAETNNIKYTSLQAAVDAAVAGATVKLVDNATGAGVVINKNITIDLDGHTYTVNKCVGSAGTETLGFQILKDNDVTIKNGTLAATAVTEGNPVKMLVQNYANLTLVNVALDGTGSEKMQYVLSNNSGNVSITGTTSITAPEGAVAFDVYDYSSAGYAVPTVNVSTTGKITGKIEVSETATLAISDGVYTVPVEAGWCAAGYVPTQNADGTYGVVEADKVVATIGDMSYTSLERAVAAADKDDVIVLDADDYEITAPVVIEKNLTLDLNGCTIIGAKNSAEEQVYPVIRVQGDADVTVKDSSEDKTGGITNDDYVFVLGASDGSSAGYLTIESGKFHGATTVASVTKGKLTVKGGKFSVTPYGGDGYANYNYLLNCIDANYKDGSAKIEVMGGEFENFNPANNAAEGIPTNFVVDGYEATTSNGVVWTVAEAEEADVVAQNNETGETYATVSEALAAASSGETVHLLANATDGNVLIPAGVTLDLGEYNLTADYVVGFSGSFVTATPNAGKLFVAENSISLSEQGYVNGSGQYVLPVWDPEARCFVFSLFVLNTGNDDRGLFIDEDNQRIYFQFKHQATAAINESLLADGATDNGLAVIVRLEWQNENGAAYQDFVYSDEFVGKAVGSYDYTFNLEGYGAMIDDDGVDTLKVTAMIVSDSGATAYGETWTSSKDKLK